MIQRPIFLHATNHSKVLLGFKGDSSFEIVFVPMYETVFSQVLESFTLFDSVVISSQKTVHWLKENPTWISKLQNKEVYVVGRQTAEFLVQMGIQPVEVAHDGFSSLKRKLDNRSVSFVGGKRLASPTTTFLKNHPKCNHLVVYERIWANHQLLHSVENIQVVLATSPSVVDGYVRYGLPRGVLMLTLGETTRSYAIDLGFYNVKIGMSGSIEKTCRWFLQNHRRLS